MRTPCASDTASIPTAIVVCCGDESFLRTARAPTARRGAAASTTAHGTVETPAFMPVGTGGTVKAMLPQSVAETGAEIVLGNTFHLMLRPGAERVAALGGLHKFMNWPRPDPDRFRRLPGDVAQGPAQARRRRRHLPLADRRLAAPPDARALDRDPAPARHQHHHVVRRMHDLAGRAGRRRLLHAAVDALGRARQARLRRPAGLRPVRHRAGQRLSRRCGPKASRR